MPDFLLELITAQSDVVRRVLEASLGVLLWLGGLLFTAVLVAVVYWMMTAPLRRRERARCFLDVLETGLDQGQSPERTVVSLSQSRVQTLGVWLHYVAAHVEGGLRLGAALDKAPWFLPPQVRAMLQAGESLGDLRAVFPAARAALQRGASATQITQNNLVAVLTMLPVGLAVNWMSQVFIVPRFREIGKEMTSQASGLPFTLFELSFLLGGILALLWLLLCAFECLPSLVPRLRARMGARLGPLVHWLDFALPWRRKRMHRDFSALLALLLDAGVPEPKALRLAASGTANHYFIARGESAARDLAAGKSLAEALRRLDDAGEFQWRLRNAVRAGAGFGTALQGWHEALEARAFQQEQTASNCLTAGFIFLNGLMVSLMAAGVFLVLLAIMEEAPLW